MAETGDRRQCSFLGCRGEMVLKPKHRLVGATMPSAVKSGDAFPETPRLSAWVCTLQPRRHIEVEGLGIRPLKDCRVEGCDGVMVHMDKARTLTPASGARQPTRAWPTIAYQSGFVCLEDGEHFEPDGTRT